jgi:hypothetical protein
LDARRRDLAEAFADGGDPKALRLTTDALNARQRRLEVELGKANNPLEQYSAEGALRDAWPTMTTDARRGAIAAAFGEITVKRATGRGCRFDPTRVVFGRA